MKESHKGDDEEVCKVIVALSPRTRRVTRHGLHPRACLLDAASGRVIHLYIHSSSSNDTKPRSRVFGAGTLPWTDLTSSENSLEQFMSHPPEQNQLRRSNSPRHITLPNQIHSASHEGPDHFLDDPGTAYYWIPPLARVHLFHYLRHPLCLSSQEWVARMAWPSFRLTEYSSNDAFPALPVGSPYQYPYRYVRRMKNYAGSYNGTVDHLQMDPNVIL